MKSQNGGKAGVPEGMFGGDECAVCVRQERHRKDNGMCPPLEQTVIKHGRSFHVQAQQGKDMRTIFNKLKEREERRKQKGERRDPPGGEG